MNDGVLRVGGHLRRTTVPEERQHPAILAKDHYMSTLILHRIHAQTGHRKKPYAIAVTENVLITNGNSAARKVLSHCVTCRKNRGKDGEQKKRLEADMPPFSNVGLDCIWPLESETGKEHNEEIWRHLYPHDQPSGTS